MYTFIYIYNYYIFLKSDPSNCCGQTTPFEWPPVRWHIGMVLVCLFQVAHGPFLSLLDATNANSVPPNPEKEDRDVSSTKPL